MRFQKLILKKLTLINKNICLTILILISLFNILFSQKSSILRGVVRDAETGEYISFATVTLSSRSAGSYTDSLGKFQFKANVKLNDSLVISFLGYNSQSIYLDPKNVNQFFDIHLSLSSSALSEVVIRADPNPGKTLMKKVLLFNEQNNPSNIDRMDSRRWVKSEVSTKDVGAVKKNGGLDVLFASRAKAYNKAIGKSNEEIDVTPLFFSEKISEFTQTNNPFGESESIIAVKKTNLESDKLLEHICRIDVPINLYESKITIYNKTFASPIGSTALLYYDYFIEDSLALENNHYNITLQLIPKSWTGNVFTGTIVINDSTYALVQADLRLSKEANINYIERMDIKESFVQAKNLKNNQAVWVKAYSQIIMQYESGLDLIGIPIPVSMDNKKLLARIEANYSDFKINDPDKSNQATKTGAAVVTRIYDTNHDEAFWAMARPDTLKAHEKAIYGMADAIKNDRAQMIKDKTFKTIVSGWYFWKDVAWIGPYGSLVSRNEIEGTRFRLRVRTDEALLKKTGLYGHIAYGTKDQKWKGSLGLKQLWSLQPYSKTELFYGQDFLIASEWYDALDADNIVNSVFRKNVPFYRTLQEQIVLTHDQQFYSNWYLRLGLANRNLIPAFEFPFQNPEFISPEKTPDVNPLKNNVHTTEASISLRYSWRERSRIFDYQRKSIASKYPTANLTFSKNIPTQKGDFDYYKLSLGILHNTRVTAKINYIWNAELGQVFGKVPALLAYIPRGNDSYFASRYLFNTMNKFEFAADKYALIQSRLALGGSFFDLVPAIKKLGWRERFSFNAFWGDMTEENKVLNAPAKFALANGKPYVELGVGIENIFHLFSIDYFYRLNYPVPYASSGLFGGIKAFF